MACGGHHTAAVGDHLQVMTWGGGQQVDPSVMPGDGKSREVEGR